MTRDEAAWHEAMRKGYEPAWHRWHSVTVTITHAELRRWRTKKALRRFWRALKG